MNEILLLNGKFEQKGSDNKPGACNLPKGKSVSASHLDNLRLDLISVREFYNNEKLNINPLVSFYYTDVVAKSNRIKGFLYGDLDKNNNSIVGAKFSNDTSKKHIITHCVEDKYLLNTINNLQKAIEIINDNFDGYITFEDIKLINDKKYEYLFNNQLSRTRFGKIVVDSYYLEHIGIEKIDTDIEEKSIVNIYDTGVKTVDIMNMLDIKFREIRSIDETTLLLTPDQFSLLKSRAPYLISMAVTDITTIEKVEVQACDEINPLIPKPSNEPIIGVIDTLFDKSVYFSEWVEYKNLLDEAITNPEDKNHGTMVTSLIVDGASINPNLDDGCGRFRVRHFGVASSGVNSSFTILRLIKEIVESNRDIKVWNLSLGSKLEINQNFISPEAAILDKIQYENDVIFVVAGTNKDDNSNIKRIGAPADSINSLVINSVSFDNKPASYSREGLVLSFFNKPDVSYYGGDGKEKIRVCSPMGECFVKGTSFAAPLIARKLAYLIEVLGLNRELAKALIIDSATGWSDNKENPQLIGYGIVPIKISDIVNTPEDEIKFLISGISNSYESYNYDLPVPIYKQAQPFVSKATLCYFPKCSRNQGVDYTNTEMDIHFGCLVENKDKRIQINTINNNKQSEEGAIILYEGNARKNFRKWDNVKHIRENLLTPTGRKKQAKSLKTPSGKWGIKMVKKGRLGTDDGNNLKFGIVVTLKEINGVNRIHQFIQSCKINNFNVTRIDVKNRIDIYNKADEEVKFD